MIKAIIIITAITLKATSKLANLLSSPIIIVPKAEPKLKEPNNMDIALPCFSSGAQSAAMVCSIGFPVPKPNPSATDANIRITNEKACAIKSIQIAPRMREGYRITARP